MSENQEESNPEEVDNYINMEPHVPTPVPEYDEEPEVPFLSGAREEVEPDTSMPSSDVQPEE